MNRRARRFACSPDATFWVAFFAVLAVFGLGSIGLHAESAKSFFKRGQAAEARRTTMPPIENYQKAYAMAPSDLAYRTAVYRVRISASSLHATKGRKLLADR